MPFATVQVDTMSIEPGENLFHFGGVRTRVNGTGNLVLELQSLDDANIFDLVSQVMSTTTPRERFTLANFVEQRAFLKVSTINIDEHFTINRLIVFVRPIWGQYPDE